MRFTRDANVAGQREFATTAATVSVDHGNHGLGNVSIAVNNDRSSSRRAACRRATREFGDVRAGDNALSPAPREHDYADEVSFCISSTGPRLLRAS